jgi:hypothetical protein
MGHGSGRGHAHRALDLEAVRAHQDEAYEEGDEGSDTEEDLLEHGGSYRGTPTL